MPLPARRRQAKSLIAVVLAMLTAGCERAAFGVINRGAAAPDTSVMYAPAQQLSLDIYRPRAVGTQVAGDAPVLVFFYGGAWQRGARAQYRFVGQRFADAGVLTIVADYRTWPRAGFPDFVQDGAAAIAWAHAHARDYGGDPGRLFVSGHSAGAQIAALIGADARYLARHSLRPKQLAGVIGLSGPYDFNVTGVYQQIFGPPSQWPQAQAVNFVDGDEPPFLLIHGDADQTVETADSRQFADALRARGVAVELLLLPGGGHLAPMTGIYSPSREPKVLPAMLDFIRHGNR